LNKKITEKMTGGGFFREKKSYRSIGRLIYPMANEITQNRIPNSSLNWEKKFYRSKGEADIPHGK